MEYANAAAVLADGWVQVAHRGGSADYAEHSAQAYQRAYAAGYRVMEVAVAVSAQPDGTPRGGTLFLLHDSTLDRTSGTSGMNAQATPWATIQGLQITPPAGARPDATAQPYLTFDQYLEQFGADVITVLDMKYLWPADRARVHDAIQARGLGHRVIGKTVYGGPSMYDSALAVRNEFHDRGMPTWGAFYAANEADFAELSALHDLVGMEYTASAGVWSALIAAAPGKHVLGHICATAAHVSTAVSKGATGVMVSSPYLAPGPEQDGDEPGTDPIPGGVQGWSDVIINGKHATAVYVGSTLAWGRPVVPDVLPEPKPRVVAIYNGTDDTADTMFYEAMGPVIGAAASYYTINARQGGRYVLRSWDTTRIARGYVPYIHLQSVAWNNDIGANVQYYPWKHVAEGVHDDVFVQWAEALADAPAGTSFSFDGEPEVRLEAGSHQPVPNPNGPAAGWPAGWPQNGDGLNTPAYYAAAQRRIYEVMHPIAPDLDYRFWFAGHLTNTYMESFYPGDAYVDSIGFDPYVWGYNAASTTPLQKYQPIVTWLRSRTWGQGKPIGISETGFDTTVHGDAAGAAFWDAMPAAMEALDLSWVMIYNRDQFRITPDTYPLSWAAFLDAMAQIAAQ